MTPLTTGLRVEFAQVNKISLIRVEGRLTDRRHAIASPVPMTAGGCSLARRQRWP